MSSKGEAIFIYSDLGHNLGLEEKERVENLAKEKGLLAQKIDETALGVPKKVLDPLKQVKSMSKVQLIKIVKQWKYSSSLTHFDVKLLKFSTSCRSP